MLRHFQKAFLALVVAGTIHSAQAFSLLGPLASWQVFEIGYGPLFNADVGGPMNLGEEYRWNVPTLTYGFDSSFLNYFGQKGVDAVSNAFAILNALPAFSKMSTNLDEFPLDTRRENYRASALGLLDMKSTTLGAMMEQLGLASPDRFTWTIRDREVDSAGVPSYLVIKRNFDPVTWEPSSYVNGVLYTYAILQIYISPVAWDAVEIPVDPLAFTSTAVASDMGNYGASIGGNAGGGLGLGQYYVGLTRDDVGSLRYIYSPKNYNIENLFPGAFGSGGAGGSSPFSPVITSNGFGGFTNSAVNTALRPGVDHITFQQVQYNSTLGSFITVTNTYKDSYVTNNSQVSQTLQRVIGRPDILIAAADLNEAPLPFPIPPFPAMFVRTVPGWVNNNGLNSQSTIPLDGPGVINGQVQLLFSKLGPNLLNIGPFPDGTAFLDEFNSFNTGILWGSFDGTTNDPIVFPSGISIQQLEQQVLGGH